MNWEYHNSGGFWYINLPQGDKIFLSKMLFKKGFYQVQFTFCNTHPEDASTLVSLPAQDFEQAKEKALEILRQHLENTMLRLDELEGME